MDTVFDESQEFGVGEFAMANHFAIQETRPCCEDDARLRRPLALVCDREHAIVESNGRR